MEKRNQGIRWSSLIMGVLLLILAVVILTFPIENSYIVTWLIGPFVLVNGVIQIVYRRKARALVGGNQKWILFMGIVDILFGLLIIFNVGASSAFFIYMFASWFILSSISGLSTFSGSGSLKLISVIFNSLDIVFGVTLLFNPLIGIVFISTMIVTAFVFADVIYVVDALVQVKWSDSKEGCDTKFASYPFCCVYEAQKRGATYNK